MQQLSNDTSSWNLIDIPLPIPLFYNSNTYENLPNGDPIIDHRINLAPIDSISTHVPSSGITDTSPVNYWAFGLIFFPLFTIFGNVLVVVSVYREKSLHTVTNYFVVSLAISDITVAAVVMPFAIYLEYKHAWKLSERLCDFWVASDCMACTASILNLVAIAVDRYIAVTKPLKYARHKNPKRVAIMIVIVWLVSFFIALPIVSGVNKSDVPDYPRVPDECAFFNNKFLIFSSLGSFFIPCIIIFAIYYRIFMVIMARARKNRKQWRPKAAIQSAAAQHRDNANHLVTSFLHEHHDTPNNNNDTNTTNNNNNHVQSRTPLSTKPSTNIHETAHLANIPERNVLMLQLATPVLSPTVRASINVTSSSGDQLDDDERDDIALFVHQEQEDHHRAHPIEICPKTNRSSNCPLDESAIFQMTTRSSQTEDQTHTYNPVKQFKTRLKTKTSSDGLPVTLSTTQTSNTKNAKRKAYSRMKKERKATQTLIIVLICFLVCWLPFFVLNNLVNTIFKLTKKTDTLLINNFTLSLCVWLGYINSFLNPIIYTIFNLEFRKAFAKILFSPCRVSNH